MTSLARRKQQQLEKMLRQDACRDTEKYNRKLREEREASPPAVIPSVSPEIYELPSLLDAQAMYMRSVPMAVIARETGISLPVIRTQVYAPGGWKSQRDELQKDVNESVKQSALSQLQQATGMTLILIIGGLKKFAADCEKRGNPPTLEETQLVAGIFSRIHKAKIVEELDPESRKALSLSPQEILRSLAQDPYLRLAITAQTEELPGDEELESKDEDVSGPRKDSESLAYPTG